METQICKFHDGGAAVHKITLPEATGRFSAWFNSEGKLLEAEQFVKRSDGGEHTRPVKRNVPLWRALARRSYYIKL